MAIVGFGAPGGTGGGPGGSLPASAGLGDILQGDGAGTWVSAGLSPGVAGPGQIPYWVPANPSYALSPIPTAQGQMLQWENVLGTWELTAAPANGDVLVYDSATGLWVPRPITTNIYSWTAGSVIVGTSFIIGDVGGTTFGSEAQTFPLPFVVDGFIDRLFVRQNTPTAGAGTITYAAFVEGAVTALSVAMLESAAQASNIADVVAVAEGQRLSLRCVSTAAGTVTVRCRVQMRFRSFA